MSFIHMLDAGGPSPEGELPSPDLPPINPNQDSGSPWDQGGGQPNQPAPGGFAPVVQNPGGGFSPTGQPGFRGGGPGGQGGSPFTGGPFGGIVGPPGGPFGGGGVRGRGLDDPTFGLSHILDVIAKHGQKQGGGLPGVINQSLGPILSNLLRNRLAMQPPGQVGFRGGGPGIPQ